MSAALKSKYASECRCTYPSIEAIKCLPCCVHIVELQRYEAGENKAKDASYQTIKFNCEWICKEESNKKRLLALK